MRKKIIKEIAAVINQIELPHPVRVAVDGSGASGKTTFADELVEPLEKLGRTVIRATIDGFHNPAELRRQKGQFSPQGYLEDSYNYPALEKYLLEPLGPSGNLKYKKSVYNFRINQPTSEQILTAEKNSILIFEGIFLFNEFLFSYWDYKLYIDASFETTMQRAIIRDSNLFGGNDKTIELYKKRYIPGHKLYQQKYKPKLHSDIVLNNEEFNKLHVVKLSDNKLHKNLYQIRNHLNN